jgi:hypothetical protein
VKYKVVRVVEFTYELDAQSSDEAVAASRDMENPAVRLVREHARSLEKRAPGRAATTDRELRPGRRFTAKHKGREYTAVVTDTGEIEVEGLGTFKSLNAAGQAIVQHAVNAWAFWRDAEPAKPSPAARPKAKKDAKAKARAKGTQLDQAEPVEPPAEEPAAEVEQEVAQA